MLIYVNVVPHPNFFFEYSYIEIKLILNCIVYTIYCNKCFNIVTIILSLIFFEILCYKHVENIHFKREVLETKLHTYSCFKKMTQH